MTVSARFPPELAGKLHQYCVQTRVSKTNVVREAVAEYLVRVQAPMQPLPGDRSGDRVGVGAPDSAVFRSFQAAGLVGRGKLEPGESPQADKQAVRQAASARRAAKA